MKLLLLAGLLLLGLAATPPAAADSPPPEGGRDFVCAGNDDINQSVCVGTDPGDCSLLVIRWC